MAPVGQVCAGCRGVLSKRDSLTCSNCGLRYDLDCANVTSLRFSTMLPEHKRKWNCCECMSKLPKTDNSNTPVRSVLQELPEATSNVGTESVAQRSRRPGKMTAHIPTENNMEDNTKNNIDRTLESFKADLLKEFRSLKTEFSKVTNVLSEIKELKTAVEFMSGRYDELVKVMEEKSNIIATLREENVHLKEQVDSLTIRISQQEQISRECNIVLDCVPESRNENIMSIVKQTAKVVSYPLQEGNVLSCFRVAKTDKESTRPRSIVVKLPSVRCRDEFIAAVRVYNKSQNTAASKLSSSLLGIAGPKLPVFVSEHLSPSNKALHAAARHAVRSNGYKYIWIRNGTIYVRKDDKSPSIIVKNIETLKRL